MGQLAFGIVLVVGGSFAQSPAIVLLGLVIILVEGVRQVWTRRGLEGVEYRRRLPHPRGIVGDEIPLDVTIWNRKALPLAWLRVEDGASSGVEVRERPLVEAAGGGDALHNAWTLAPFERVVRHFHVVAGRRGVFALGPARVEVGDLFARSAAVGTEPSVVRWLVRPRSVRVATAEREDPWGGDLRARRGLLDDPTRYAGVRAYQPGDPLRRIHWRATARLGTPVSKLFDPARHREVVIALDIQTVGGPTWLPAYDDDLVEGLCVAAASLVRRLRAEGAAVGLAAAAYSGATRPIAYVAPGASDAQVERCLDLLARLSSFPSAPFERLLTTMLRALRPGTALLVLSARDPTPYLPALRRVAASGYRVQFLAFGGGPEATVAAARVRSAGLDGRVARLDGPWRTSGALVVAG